MALWFTEQHTDDVRFSIHIKEQLYSGKSYYQQIEVFDSYEFGRVLVLDGYIMLTEKDEYIYHEMMVHVPMACNPDIRRVLVIGAGDGGTVRELCRYDSITQIDMVEIDEQVVKVCKEYLPQTAWKIPTILSLWIPRTPSAREKDCSPRNFTGTVLRRSGSMAF